uniref:Uncharacterized protein n=1 Tax=Panagrolaimus sp. ES5 TaxID=591445 RepID=A0AC34FG70_9BILA
MFFFNANIINDHCIIHLKEASLQALGYICQDVDKNALEKNSNEILNSIYLGMKHNDATVRLSATEAMLNALELNKFQCVRHCLMLAQECQKNEFCDTRIRVAALQCLVRVVSLYYNQMQMYMKAALEITVYAIESTDYDVSLQGIEFWSNICEFESLLTRRGQAAVNLVVENQCEYYSKGALQHILPSILNILAIQEEDDDDDEWSPAKSAGVCITLFAQCTKDLIIPCTLSFIHQHLESPNWRFREAAITAFGSILDGPSHEYINQLVEGELISLINTLDDPHVKVRSTSVWAIGRVCDFCKYIVTRNEYCPKLISAFFKALGQEPAVAFNASWVRKN